MMIRKSIMLIGAVLMLTVSRAQEKYPEALTRMVNSTLMYQVMNDFNRAIPLVLTAPGFFYIGNVKYTANPLFDEGNYYDDDGAISSEYYQKEVFDMVDAGFISYIPEDSIMQVRVIEGKQMLFELKFMKKGDTLLFMQTDAKRNRNKTAGFANGKVISVSYADTDLEMNFYSQLVGDSIRVSRMIDKKTGKNTSSVMHYRNGFLSSISHYNKVGGDDQLVSQEIFFQNESNKPARKHTLNRKGRVTDSTSYYYDGEKLVHSMKLSGREEKLSVSLMYNRAGKLSGKTVKSPLRNYTCDYSYSKGLISDLEIDDKLKTFRRHYVFRPDVGKRLSSIEYSTISKESMVEEMKTRWLFDYHGSGNLGSVKVMDSKGLITQEISLEYTFY